MIATVNSQGVRGDENILEPSGRRIATNGTTVMQNSTISLDGPGLFVNWSEWFVSAAGFADGLGLCGGVGDVERVSH